MLVVDTFDVRPEFVESKFDVFVSSVDLRDVGDSARSTGTECSDEQGDTCTDVGACHSSGTESDAVVVSDNNGSVWVTKNDLRTHIDEFVDKEKSALEHLLVEEHTSLCLCGDDEQHREQVGGKSWPRCVG